MSRIEPSTFGSQVAAALITARKGAHLSQAEIALRLCISPRTARAWESGAVTVPAARVDEWMRACRVQLQVAVAA
jgi:transcriptional regulator with XRE-family HTH domain